MALCFCMELYKHMLMECQEDVYLWKRSISARVRADQGADHNWRATARQWWSAP
jgi:hypothetical protein